MSAVIPIKRRLADATQRIIKARDPDLQAFANALAALGDLLGEWSGETVTVRVEAAGHPEAVLDMTKHRRQ